MLGFFTFALALVNSPPPTVCLLQSGKMKTEIEDLTHQLQEANAISGKVPLKILLFQHLSMHTALCQVPPLEEEITRLKEMLQNPCEQCVEYNSQACIVQSCRC